MTENAIALPTKENIRIIIRDKSDAGSSVTSFWVKAVEIREHNGQKELVLDRM